MPVVVASNSSHTVVVNRDRNIGSVTASSTVVRVPDAGASLGAVTESATAVNVSSPGPQGPAGTPGGTADARIADGALGGHRIVRSTGADTVGYASNADSTHGDDTVGMTLGAAADGGTIDVQRSGSVTFNGWAWTPGEPVFLGADGGVTQVVPDASAAFIQIIGHAESATVLNLHIEPPFYY
jgi:hypothetical protein